MIILTNLFYCTVRSRSTARSWRRALRISPGITMPYGWFINRREGAWQQFNQDTRSKRYTLDFHDLRESDDALDRMMQLGEALQSA